MVSLLGSASLCRRIALWPALALALLGPVAGVTSYRLSRERERERVLAAAREDVRQRAFDLSRQLAGATEAVVAVAALFEASEAVTREEFRVFTLPVLARHQCLAALEWVPRIPFGGRHRHESEARREGLAGYRIWRRAGADDAAAAGPPDAYPVTYVEPLAGNASALGFDLGSDRTRAAALARASQADQPTLTDPLRLVQEEGSSTGLLLVVPVHHETHANGDGSRRALQGFAVAVLRVDALVERSLLAGWRSRPDTLALELTDDDVGGKPVVIYPNPSQHATGPAEPALWREPIEQAGRRWSLSGRATPAYLAAHRTSQPIAVGIAALLGSELLLGLGLLTARHLREKERLGEADLLHSVLHSIGEGVLVADTEGKLLIANDCARRLLGGRPTEVPLAEWPTAFGLYQPGTDLLVPAEEIPMVRAIRGEEVTESELFLRNPGLPAGAWLSVSGAPLRDRGGELLGGVVVLRDVTSGKRADELTRRLSNAVEQTADSVFITDREGVIEYVNPAFEQTTGFARHEAVGQTPRLLKSGEQGAEYYAALWDAILSGRTFKATVLNRRKGGAPFVAEQTITPMRDARTGRISHFVSVMRDMTERMALQEKEVEMRLAASIQRRLFPQRPPSLAGWDIAGVVAPALATCGDYFDFVDRADGILAIAVADVCGHGFGSALIMAETRAYLRSLVRTGLSADRLLGEISTDLLADLDEGLFVTMLLVLLDTASGAVRWANAGHPTGYVLDRSGALKAELASTGLPLGLFPDRPVAEGSGFTLLPGDLMVLMTDGVPETAAADGCQLGAVAALEVVRAHRGLPAAEIANRLLEAAGAFREGHPQEDDLTVVVCRREGGQ